MRSQDRAEAARDGAAREGRSDRSTTPAFTSKSKPPAGRHARGNPLHRYLGGQILPPEFATALQQLRGDRLNVTLRAAHEAGWQFTTLAAPLGVTRQQVSRRAATAAYRPSATTVPIPEPEN